jgi:hypothetical protein
MFINCNIDILSIPNNKIKNRLKVLLNGCLFGFNKNVVWLDKALRILYKRRFSDTEYQARVLSFFKLYSVFVSKYGKDFEVLFYMPDNNGYIEFYFATIYPIFDLTNSENYKHTIRDLVVCHTFKFTNNNYHPGTPKGGRLTKTTLEINGNYQQSHLPSYSSWLDEPCYVQTFCIGHDDASRMIAEFTIEMDYDRFELYLYLIDAMVKWESIEGVPYYFMNKIVDPSFTFIIDSNYREESKFVEDILSQKTPLDVDFYVSEGRYRIAINKKAEDFIKNQLDFYSTNLYNAFCCTYSPFTKRYYSKYIIEQAQKKKKLKVKSKQYFIYQGEKKYSKIINNPEQPKEVLEKDYIIYPKFLKNVLRKLEYCLYEKAIAYTRDENSNTSEYAKQSTTTDTISL